MWSIFYRLIPLAALIAVIYVLSSVRGYAQPKDSSLAWLVANTPMPVQKLMHVLLYAILSALIYWILEKLTLRPSHRLAAAFIVAVAYGAFNEWRQLQLPGRFGTAMDVALNALGAGLGLLVAMLI